MADDAGSSAEGFNLVYQGKNGEVSVSGTAGPPAIKNKSENTTNHYYIFIEKYLTDIEKKNIVKEYEKGNTNSKLSVRYDITINNEEQNGSGMADNFELFNGPALDPALFPPNLNFFKVKYPQK